MVDIQNKAESLSDDWKKAAHTILARTGTPFYIFQTNQVANNLAIFKRSFSIKNRPVNFFYSVKTNPATALLSVISDAGWGLLASSEGDLKLAKQIKSKSVIFDAPFKRNEDLQIALDDLGALVVCENSSDLDIVTNLACASTPIKVGLRIMIPSSVSGHLSRFGFDLERLINSGLLEKLRILKLVGSITSLHFHLGGQPAVPEQFYKLAGFVSKVWKEFSSQGFEIRTLSLGGGIPCSLSEEMLHQYSDAVEKGLAEGQLPDFVRILFEPGRAIIENTGMLCVKVVDISVRQGERFALVDGGSNLVMPMWMLEGRPRTIQKLNSNDFCERKSDGHITVVGPLCAENDKIGQMEDVSGISVGDILIIRNCGAYDWSTRFHFGGKMPSTYLVGESGHSEMI